MTAHLDISFVKCPRCGNFFAESSWYVVEMESDLKCGKCGKEFNTKENMSDRIMAKFEMDENGKVKSIGFERQK